LFTASPIAYDLMGGDRQERELKEKEERTLTRKLKKNKQ
jgi:hypothetical protein